VRAEFCLLPGDGVGPEVIEQGVRVLEAVAERFGHDFEFETALIGGCAIDATGDPLPEATVVACGKARAVLLGAVGGPKWSDPQASVRPEQGLLRLRSQFELFCNLRPVATYPGMGGLTPLRDEIVEGTDILFVRELTGGIYFGERSERQDGEAWDTMRYTEIEVERLARVAFQAARGRRSKVTSIDKANVLASSRLWRQVTQEVAADFEDVELEHMLVDAATMHLLTRPREFDVVLAGNLFGDILSDEASVFAGSLGMLGSASVNESRFGVYEPVHGSAPDIAGLGVANPVGMFNSCAMALRHSLQLEAEALAIETAIESTLRSGARTRDLGDGPHLNTAEFTDRFLQALPTPVAS
jgi:3-isopropylmalate dehydrogenase